MLDINDLHPYLCAPETPVRAALAHLNNTEHLFQVIVEADSGRCLGTLTDGDIRRALLNGLRLESPVKDCMFTEYTAGQADHPAANHALLHDPARMLRFLPLVDACGVLTGLVVRADDPSGLHTAVVMAGGFGTRLEELTRETPKPLLTVGDRPILEHVLTRLEDAGVQEVFISLHYLGAQIRDYVAVRESRAQIRFIEEQDPLGTAGALSLLPEHSGGPVLVVNGDVITTADLPALFEFHSRQSLDATIGVTPYEVDVPFGVVRIGKNGLLSGIEEKPRITEFVAAGVYLLEASMLSLVSRGRRLDMPELLQRGTEIGQRIGVFPIHEYWVDVGRKTDLKRADGDHSDADNTG
jgi:dTDP-glucose pyrophosphorylase